MKRIPQALVLGPVLFNIYLNNTGFELAIRNWQFVKHFGNLRMKFCIFSKNYKSLKSDTS